MTAPFHTSEGASGGRARFVRAVRNALKPALRPLVRAARRFRRTHVSTTIVAPDGSAAFSMIGTTRWQPRFSRLCIGDPVQFDTRHAVYGSSWVPHARALAERHGVVVVSDTPVPASCEPDLLNIPAFVALRVDLGDSEQEFRSTLSRSALEDLRRITRRRLSCAVERDAGFAEEFYSRFHRPSIVGRHGEEGFVMLPHELAAMVTEQGCEFVCVYQDGRRVGALLNGVERDRYALHRVGWLDGDSTWPTQGVTAALYWFSLQRARERGFRHVLLGGTPPMLEAGLFQFKTKWNATLDPRETVWGSHPVLLEPSHANTQRMLRDHSLVVLAGEAEFIVISGKAPGDVRLPAATRSSIARWYRLRDTPVTAGEDENIDLPSDLRSWFRREPMQH